MEAAVIQPQTVDMYADEEEYVESEDPYLTRILIDDNVMKYIRMRYEFELIDTHAALPIFVDLHDWETRDVDFSCVGCFVNHCYNKHTLEIYDRPGDPRIAGYFHLHSSARIPEYWREVGVYAFNWYHHNHPEGKTKQLKEVTRMSCNPDCHPFFYMTFTVVDEVTNEEVTLQAQVIQLSMGPVVIAHLQLGMLRDASHDRILAAIRFQKAPTGDTYVKLKKQLKRVWEIVMMKDDSKDSC